MENLFVKVVADWDGFTAHPKEFHDAGDTVAVEGRDTASHKATGKSLDAQFCQVIRAKDGKLTGSQQYVDRADAGCDGNAIDATFRPTTRSRSMRLRRSRPPKPR
jgi:hypothetical protein